MSIEQKSKTAAPSRNPASPVGNTNADAIPQHPIADLFPALAEKELTELAEDIAANGQREPGVVWNGKLLDGKNRQLACKLKNIPFKAVTKDFDNEHEAIAFSISANLRRRHLDESQRAMIGAKFVEFMAAAKPQAASTHVAGGTQESRKSRHKAAAAVNVSSRSIQNAIKVLADGTSELVNAVTAGEASVSAAAQVASLGKDEQAKIVKTPGGVKAAAKKLRNEKKAATKHPEKKIPANSLPENPGASSPDPLKNTDLSKENKLPAAKEQPKASPAEQALIKNRLRFTPNDAEIEQGSQIFKNANTAYPDCEALAVRLLDGKHPGEAAATWASVEAFAAKMRQAFERMNENLTQENPSHA